MKIVNMIPPKAREHQRCYFCNANKSVKYLVKLDINNNEIVPVCNMCVAKKEIGVL